MNMRFQQLHEEDDHTQLNGANVENWGTAEVGTWLRQRGCGQYAHAFQKHRINGHSLLRLDDDQLADIIPGQPVGDRLTLLADAQRITGGEQTRKRFRVLWEDSSPDFVHGPCDWMCKVRFARGRVRPCARVCVPASGAHLPFPLRSGACASPASRRATSTS